MGRFPAAGIKESRDMSFNLGVRGGKKQSGTAIAQQEMLYNVVINGRAWLKGCTVKQSSNSEHKTLADFQISTGGKEYVVVDVLKARRMEKTEVDV